MVHKAVTKYIETWSGGDPEEQIAYLHLKSELDRLMLEVQYKEDAWRLRYGTGPKDLFGGFIMKKQYCYRGVRYTKWLVKANREVRALPHLLVGALTRITLTESGFGKTFNFPTKILTS